jgi:hypothetical protein
VIPESMNSNSSDVGKVSVRSMAGKMGAPHSKWPRPGCSRHAACQHCRGISLYMEGLHSWAINIARVSCALQMGVADVTGYVSCGTLSARKGPARELLG